MAIFSEYNKVKLYINNKKIKKVFLTNKKIYSSGNIVTYHVDDNHTYSEEMDEGRDCLSPTSFLPEKEGWIFTGWRENTLPDSEILSEKNMGNESLNLYAVFYRHVIISYNADGGDGVIPDPASGICYYNNQNINPVTIILPNGTVFSKNFYTQTKWKLKDSSTGEEHLLAFGESAQIINSCVVSPCWEIADRFYLFKDSKRLAPVALENSGKATTLQSVLEIYPDSGRTALEINEYNPNATSLSANGYLRFNVKKIPGEITTITVKVYVRLYGTNSHALDSYTNIVLDNENRSKSWGSTGERFHHVVPGWQNPATFEVIENWTFTLADSLYANEEDKFLSVYVRASGGSRGNGNGTIRIMELYFS